MALSLTDEQKRVVLAAKAGHNLLLSGKAGTGKSFVVNSIVKTLRRRGCKVVVVCSSGIACTVYNDDKSTKAFTVHSHYALLTADMPSGMVVERATALPHSVARIRAADTVIWDEAGMSSKRTFELVNAIHHATADDKDQCKAFGGKQIIIVGDFLQLRPVPNAFDSGQFLFESELFETAVPHRIELTRPMRQDQAAEHFVDALNELRMGICTDETETYLKTLSRPIDGEHVHIYFRKLSVDMHNLDVLFTMPGELRTFDCVDEGDTTGISCPAPVRLLLKPGAKVMLVWNLSQHLRNGSSGTFIRITENGHVEIEFPIHGIVIIKKQTWSKRNRVGQVVGIRTQFPVVLFYASTCHKVQGLTLPGAVVHCCREFVAGLIYVAVSRVKRDENVQLLDFHQGQLLPPSEKAVDVCNIAAPFDSEDCTCCKDRNLPERLFTVSDKGEEFCDDDRDAPECLAMEAYPDGFISSFFESEEDNIVVDLAHVYRHFKENENELSNLPLSIDINLIIEEEIIPSPKTEFAIEKNSLITHTLQDVECMSRLFLLAKIEWYKIFFIFSKHITSNIDEDLCISRKDLSNVTNKVYTELIGSVDFTRELRAVFQVQEVLEMHRTIGCIIVNELYRQFVHHLAEKLQVQHETESLTLSMSEMPIEGLAKIRHVGGWAIRKALQECRRYMRANMFSTGVQTRQKVKMYHAKCKLLEEHVIDQYCNLKDNTAYPGTLDVTEDRQFRERGLLHISDACFIFFRKLEELRITVMNTSKLLQSFHKDQFVDHTILEINNDEMLSLLWDDMFIDAQINSEEQDLVPHLKNGVVTRYMRMASCQFLKDFRRSYNLSKSSEHRKKVLQRQQVAAVKRDHLPFQKIVDDDSPGKRNSHTKLFAFIDQYKADGIAKVYLKTYLSKLCKAYGITARASDNKKKLATALVSKVLLDSDGGFIPQPWIIENQLPAARQN